MTLPRAALILAALGLTTGCSLAFPGDEYTSGGSAGAGGTSTAGAGGAGSGGGTAGSGACQGEPGCVDGLLGDGLVARYFIDEAASGTGVEALVSEQSTGPNLLISYADDFAFGERDGNRGLFWNAVGGAGSAYCHVAGTSILDALAAAETATFELVVAVDERPGTLLRFTNGLSISLTADALDVWWGVFPNPIGCGWTYDRPDGVRRVLHLVVDGTSQPPMAALVDGYQLSPQAPCLADPPLALAKAADSLVLGNEQDGDASIRGGILYLAIYGSALSQAQIDNNRDRLLRSDDR